MKWRKDILKRKAKEGVRQKITSIQQEIKRKRDVKVDSSVKTKQRKDILKFMTGEGRVREEC